LYLHDPIAAAGVRFNASIADGFSADTLKSSSFSTPNIPLFAANTLPIFFERFAS
jgi:hypothetical protein